MLKSWNILTFINVIFTLATKTFILEKVYNILLADDDEDDLSILSAVLENDPQFNVIGQLNNGRKIIDYLHSGPRPDLIITDLYMPIMTGTEVVDHLLKTGALRDMRIVVFSTTVDKSEEEKFAMLENITFMAKPNSLQSYSELSEKLLDYMLI